ncbi:MAG TPA: helix-turn-helix domain-containing protein [Acidimicrobiales bacterium]|nr:helix-turn-helix domain-containing protein [Acidimicrobiales bacterium]
MTTTESALTETSWTKKQVAAYLQICERSVDNHVESGELPAPKRLGRSTRWHPQTVRDSVAAGDRPVTHTAKRPKRKVHQRVR